MIPQIAKNTWLCVAQTLTGMWNGLAPWQRIIQRSKTEQQEVDTLQGDCLPKKMASNDSPGPNRFSAWTPGDQLKRFNNCRCLCGRLQGWSRMMEVKLEMGDYGCPGSTSSGWCRVDVIFLFSQQWLVSVLCLKQLLIVLLCSFSGALSASFYESYQQP